MTAPRLTPSQCYPRLMERLSREAKRAASAGRAGCESLNRSQASCPQGVDQPLPRRAERALDRPSPAIQKQCAVPQSVGHWSRRVGIGYAAIGAACSSCGASSRLRCSHCSGPLCLTCAKAGQACAASSDHASVADEDMSGVPARGIAVVSLVAVPVTPWPKRRMRGKSVSLSVQGSFAPSPIRAGSVSSGPMCGSRALALDPSSHHRHHHELGAAAAAPPGALAATDPSPGHHRRHHHPGQGTELCERVLSPAGPPSLGHANSGPARRPQPSSSHGCSRVYWG